MSKKVFFLVHAYDRFLLTKADIKLLKLIIFLNWKIQTIRKYKDILTRNPHSLEIHNLIFIYFSVNIVITVIQHFILINIRSNRFIIY